MSIDLQELKSLVINNLTFSDEKEYHLTLEVDLEKITLLSKLSDLGAVEEFSNDQGVIFASNMKVGEKLVVKLVQFRLERFGFYNTFERFVDANSLKYPQIFYVKDLNYIHNQKEHNEEIDAYFAGLRLSDCLTSLALFRNEDDGLMLYLMQEKSATSFKVLNTLESVRGLVSIVKEVNCFCEGFKENLERKMIYQKELIDFLNDYPLEERYLKLSDGFANFYRRCEAAYGFFLSDFSYGKLKLELEATVLDYSKNVRSIINDSQNKLIAIPAAFLVASSQLQFDRPFGLKNFMIIFASFVFSLLIEIFIRNQESSVTIFLDNVKNYKTTFGFKNKSIDQRINVSLNGVINKSFTSIDSELDNQKSRLNIIRWVNWGMSILLVMVIAIVYTFSNF